jgi:hypothetical protein
MPPIEGQFHHQLRLIRDDADDVIGIAVSGPITHWDSDANGASIKAEISRHGTVLARSRGGDDVESPATVWMVAATAEADVALRPGPARGDATATVHTANGDETVTWPQDVELI